MENLKLSDLDYFDFSRQSYENWKKGDIIKIGSPTIKWTVLDVRDTSNGYQGIALVPLSGYKEGNFENIVLASRGTELTKGDGDVSTDYDFIAVGQKIESTPKLIWSESNRIFDADVNPSQKQLEKFAPPDNQFLDAKKFYESIQEKYNPKNVYVTGHSLGGAIAQYLVVKFFNAQGRTFAAPNIYRALDSADQRQVENGNFDSRMINYTHESDEVGTFRDEEPLIGFQMFAKEVHLLNDSNLLKQVGDELPLLATASNKIYQHLTSSFASFFQGNGQIEIAMDFEKVIYIINDIRNIVEHNFQEAIGRLKHFREIAHNDMEDLIRQMKREVGHGEWDALTLDDVDDILNELFIRKTNVYYHAGMSSTTYLYHDDELLEHIISNLEKKQEDFLETLYHAEKVARALQESDIELAGQMFQRIGE